MISVLISRKQIKEKVREIGKRIEKDFKGKELIMIGILKGSFVFFSDLIREINLPIKCDFVKVSSYKGKKSGNIKIEFLNSIPLEGKVVIIVEDIVDTGKTLKKIIKKIEKKKPGLIKVCVFLVKKKGKKFNIDYYGFEIPNKFIVGYGLDYKEKYRNLDYIGYIK